MKTYDWVVIGSGIAGAALSYELSVAGFSVLLIEQHQHLQGATRYSYGGIPYWSGTTDLTRLLAQEGIDRYPKLAPELESDIEFKYIDLLLTIAANANPQAIADSFKHFAVQPQLLDPKLALTLEPLLNPEAISGVLHYHHAYVNPELLVKAYQLGLLRHGGEIVIDQVRQVNQIGVNSGVKTLQTSYYGQNIAVCAGGIGRSLLKSSGVSVKLYFTHAEVIETVPSEVILRTIVMPAITDRLRLESEASRNDQRWDDEDYEVLAPSIDVGAIQFKNQHLRIGQISLAHTNPYLDRDLQQSEIAIRDQVKNIIPAIATIPGTCHRCLVAFSADSLPLVGAVTENIHIFSGFTSPFVFVPPLAKRFALAIAGNSDQLINQLSPHRFSNFA
ncbi:glycine/D-amino acid oxidase, deaminating [Synechococcus sp. PCC 7502]|uniref:NAD(P)/FAD-dependent oxidoreductase n=1 Tax=Synechococcus sp. PCC 7502 TaxID=1173263 RepID=UPI00029F83E1|nr:FAD-binding oxidoreductase [Synechococcus sp. PCC 7502]AFY72344.1 glycine/D-amino acid oxidase, deaminating [Synechococcus sp. PCC 7502]